MKIIHSRLRDDKPGTGSAMETGASARLAIDVGGVISVVDTDDSSGSTAVEVLARTTPSEECVEAIRLLVQLFGSGNTFILSKCKPATQLSTMEYLTRDLGGGRGSFLGRTGILPRNIVFCLQRSGGGTVNALEFHDLSDNSGAKTVLEPSVGKGRVARELRLTHFIDDREECLLSGMLEGYLIHPHSRQGGGESVDGSLILFGKHPTTSFDRTTVEQFISFHAVPLEAEKRDEAIDDCLSKLTTASGWSDVLLHLGINASPTSEKLSFEAESNNMPQKEQLRLMPKVPLGWDDFSPDQKRVYNKMKGLINLPIEEVDELYDAIPDSFGGRVVGTDAARELSHEYTSSWEGALLYSNSTSAPASTYAQDRFRREIQNSSASSSPLDLKKGTVLFTAGGPASGKTSVIRSDLVNGVFDLVMDQNLGKFDRAVEQIELALANHWNVVIVYVFKPMNLVAPAVFNRAKRIGRWAPASVVGHAHVKAQESVVKLHDKYARDARGVTIRLLETLYTKENPVPATEISVDDIRPGGRCYLGDKQSIIEEIVGAALQAAKESRSFDPRLLDAMEFGSNPGPAVTSRS